MEISELSKLPINVIANIAKLCLENDFEYEQPYNIDFDDNFEKLNDSTRWTGVQLNSILDVEFMAKFIEMNRDLLIDWIDNKLNIRDISNRFVIPQPKEFIIYYESSGRAYLIEKYKTDWSCYDKNWVEDAMQQSRENDEWNYYDGNFIENEIEDFDADNERVTKIVEKKLNKESLISRLVLENTFELIDDIDKDSLLKLRNLINQKLGL